MRICLTVLWFLSCSQSNKTLKSSVEPICLPENVYKSDLAAFEDATSAVGLDGVQGVRLSTADVNGDGWPDLLVRRGGVRVDDFSEGGTRHTWLLINRSGEFEDVTEASGITKLRGADGLGRSLETVAFADVDNDGDLDLFAGTNNTADNSPAGQRSELLLNDGSGVFTLTENNTVSVTDHENIAGATFVDVNLDGNIDLWLGHGDYTNPTTGAFVIPQDRLLIGDGNGGFVDATEDLGLTTSEWLDADKIDNAETHSRSWATLACDVNGDGSAELMSANYGRSPNHLWQNDGTGAFSNRSVASGYAFDTDQSWQDNEFAKCYCRSNRDAEGCADVANPRVSSCPDGAWLHSRDRRPNRLGGNSGTTVCADINNDGAMDLYTSEIRHWWAGAGSDGSEILINNGADGAVSFVRYPDATSGLQLDHGSVSWDEGHMTAAVFDFDNDGWMDIYTGGSDYDGNRGWLHRQASNGRFVLIPHEVGIDHVRSHGIAVADFDRDGDVDVIVGNSRSRCGSTDALPCNETTQIKMFRNVVGNRNNWLQIKLRGDNVNRAAIGAQVSVALDDGSVQTQEVGGGHGHYGIQHDMVLNFGLAGACRATVTVRWPDGKNTETVYDLVSGYRYTLDSKLGITAEVPAERK